MPGRRGEDGAPPLRRAWRRDARRPQSGGRAEADPRASRASGPKVEENVLGGLERLGDPGEASGRVLLSMARPIAAELADSPARPPRRRPGRGAGSVRRWAETCKDIDLIATATEPQALAEHFVASPLIAAAGKPVPTGCGRRPRTASRWTCGSSLPRPSATCCSTFTGSAAHNVASARGRGRPRVLRLRARDYRDRERQGRSLRRARRLSSSASATPTSSRSCARDAAS